MKRWILILALTVGLVWLFIEHFGGVTEPVTYTETDAPELRVIDPAEVIEYRDMNAVTFRLRTTTDILPGGLSAAMSPALVMWDESDFSPGGSVMLRNINHGGNPVAGVTELRTAVIQPDRIARAEFIMVPLGGPRAISHGQIRFVFEEGAATFLGGDSAAVGVPETMEDLIVSWEAWRAPGADYSILKGMDEREYQLTMRAYSGVQRFLEDALMERGWYVSTLKLPGGTAGLSELLRVSLAMGDGAGRYVLTHLFQQADDKWIGDGPDCDEEGGDAVAVWEEIGASLGPGHPSGDARLDMSGQTGYQSVLRSCATMALHVVDVTTARLIEKGMPHDGMRPTQDPEIESAPEWMTGLAHANLAGLFVRAPQAIAFVIQNPTSIPGNIPGALDKAGLLVQKNGKAITHHYTIDGDTPWGPASQLLIR